MDNEDEVKTEEGAEAPMEMPTEEEMPEGTMPADDEKAAE